MLKSFVFSSLSSAINSSNSKLFYLGHFETKDVSVLTPFRRESLLQELILFLMSHFCTFPWKCTGYSNHNPTCKIFIALTEFSGVFEPSDSSFHFCLTSLAWSDRQVYK